MLHIVNCNLKVGVTSVEEAELGEGLLEVGDGDAAAAVTEHLDDCAEGEVETVALDVAGVDEGAQAAVVVLFHCRRSSSLLRRRVVWWAIEDSICSKLRI